MPARGAVQFAAAVLAVMAVGACSSAASGPVTLPSLSSSGTASASSSSGTSASASATSVTDAQVAAEVEAAARAYFQAVNVAIGTGDTSELRRLTLSECACLALAAAVERVFAKGRSVGASWRLTSLKDAGGGRSTRVVSAEYVATPYHDVDRLGRVLAEYEGHRNTALVRLTLSGSSWRVEDFDNVKQEKV